MTAPRDRLPQAGPDAEDNPGYAEDAPHDRDEAQVPHGKDDPPSREEGGIRRDPDDVDSDD